MDVLLLYPPLTDPTAPYHSLTYLASFARANGFPSVEIRDTNIEALSHCASAGLLAEWKLDWDRRRAQLAQRPNLSAIEQIEYTSLCMARALRCEAPQAAINVLRDPESFYKYDRYSDAVRQLKLWTQCMALHGFPGQFSARMLVSSESLFSLESLSDLMSPIVLERIARPFLSYFHDVLFPFLRKRRPTCIGIGVTYTSQLPYALWLTQKLSSVTPGTLLVCGGTEVSDVWKYLHDRTKFIQLFRGADLCVIGEGETAFTEILREAGAGRSFEQIANVVPTSFPASSTDSPVRIRYEELDALPTPDYHLLPWKLYFSPHPYIFYSPTRGCYWNKCTFCDYGLNFGTPTSPWRQRSLVRVIDDLRMASKYSRFIYLSVDVLAPSALLRLAEAIVREKIDIRWAAEIRLEKYFSPDRCTLLRQSGCVAISVGFESGNERILSLIKKGTHPSSIATTIRNFTEAGIAVQMMGFTGFPGERSNEAIDSIEFLLANRNNWSVAGLGRFMLTPGAIIAQRPQEFGLSEVSGLIGADIGRTLKFRVDAQEEPRPEELADIDARKRQLITTDFDRPFAGGIDCAHSVFYYDRYGMDFPSSIVTAHETPKLDPRVSLSLGGSLVESEPYDLDNLLDCQSLQKFHEALRSEGAMPDSQGIRAALEARVPSAWPVKERNPVFIRWDGISIACSEEMWEMLCLVDGHRTLAEILSRVQCDAKGFDEVYRPLALIMISYRILVPNEASAEVARARVAEMSS